MGENEEVCPFRFWPGWWGVGTGSQSVVRGTFWEPFTIHTVRVLRALLIILGSYLPFSLSALTSVQWSFPEATWHVVTTD